jgi:hydroxymethylbilane synthase
MSIRIGTRGSKLALWQAHHIQDLLLKAHIASEIVIIETKGDQILDRSLAKIGSKGVFTQELEDQLRDGSIDIAVHSAKDLQSEPAEDLEILAFTEREVTNDVLVSLNPQLSLKSGASFVVGTSSTRRIAMLKHFYPHIRTVNMRGNLQTRMRKMEEGACDALLLAYAGVHRMAYSDKIAERLSLQEFTPAVGQGSIAIESARNLSEEKKQAIRQLTNHAGTESCLLAERAYLRRLQGGCSIPIFALATLQTEEMMITGGLISLDGKQMLKETLWAPVSEAEKLGFALAEKIIHLGGDRILAEIRKTVA